MDDKRKQFVDDFKELLKKYDCHIEADDHFEGYSECGQDIRMTVEFNDWQIEDIDLGGSVYHDSDYTI